MIHRCAFFRSIFNEVKGNALMKIITGSLKGRTIPFVNKKYRDADISSQKVKEALFSILGSLDGACFLDMYGCSGQIGFEAFSRGADTIINERDRQRFDFIWKTAESFGIIDSIRLFNYPDAVCLRYLSKRNVKVSHCFLDPPYIKKRAEVDYYASLLTMLQQSSVLMDGACVVVQYFSKNSIVGVPESFTLFEEKQYGSTSLNLYHFAV